MREGYYAHKLCRPRDLPKAIILLSILAHNSPNNIHVFLTIVVFKLISNSREMIFRAIFCLDTKISIQLALILSQEDWKLRLANAKLVNKKSAFFLCSN
jgi:hypothetical protein